jgi:hypothetical protein
MDVLPTWNRLLLVKELAFEARSNALRETGWNGSGNGAVEVEAEGARTIIFREHGTWHQQGRQQTVFSNAFRWTADFDGGSIRLEHLRFGPSRPVYLFDLVPLADGSLESPEPHVCEKDCYAARMEHDEQMLRLTWTINGPEKAETISYIYR